jgi:hypothetical protein
MKRAAFLIFVVCAFAQTTRDPYRLAYREWRVADPALERDAGATGGDLAARAAKVAAGAANYGSARAEFLKQTVAEQTQKLAWLETPPDAPSAMTLESASTLIAAESKAVKRTMDTFANDSDPGIRELRTKLAQEGAAADALNAAMEKRRRAAEAVKTANGAVAESQLKASDQAMVVETDANQAVEQSGQETAAWAQYYDLLAKVVRPRSPAPAAPRAPAAAPTVVTPLPLIRYTGEWTFPPAGGLYHGVQPESVDLVVHEENGHATGTLSARFKLPPGTTGDPVLRFDFTGDFKNTRNQVFNLTTSEGATGTLELIPGPAFNLLEVNFQTEPKPNKVRQGNVVLLKK